MNNNDNKLAEAIEKLIPIFAEYVRILQQQQQITKQQHDNMQSNQSNQSNQSTQSAGNDSSNFLSGIWNTITAPFNWLHKQEESEYARMTTLDPAKNGESEIKEFSKYGYVIPDEQMQQIQSQVKNQQEVTKQNIDNYDKGVTRGIAHDLERQKDKFIQEISQDVQEAVKEQSFGFKRQAFVEDDWLNATSRGDILRAANIHNVNHLGE